MEKFKIYIDRLKNGHTEKFTETVPSTFLKVEEKELSFPESIQVKGEAYLAEDHLVVHLSIRTAATLPCSICNASVSIPIAIADAYSGVPLSDIDSAIYDLTEEIRESILLQIPFFAECNQGKCPEREHIQEFLHPDPSAKQLRLDSHAIHFPFADLDKE